MKKFTLYGGKLTPGCANVDPAWQLTESLATSTWITDPATESWYKLKL